MPHEPQSKRAIAFFDGQNLFHGARDAFGYTFPNYDPGALAREVSDAQGWQLCETRFYTGVHSPEGNAYWHRFWAAKLSQMGRQGVITFRRELRYQNTTVSLPDGRQMTTVVGQEKGIDVRIALDIVRRVIAGGCDVVLVFSQDQDLSEVATDVRVISSREDRWLKIASAYPVGPTSRNRRGINGTDWIPFDKDTYDRCIDPRDYRPPTVP